VTEVNDLSASAHQNCTQHCQCTTTATAAVAGAATAITTEYEIISESVSVTETRVNRSEVSPAHTPE